MKALPSIAFNEFKGSAGDVTARVSKCRQVLSARSMHSSSKTPAQAVSRNRLAKISRSYKKLSDEQMKAWAVLAEKMKGISTFGSPAELTPHNAFVRINSNLQMVGEPLLTDAPAYMNDVPEVLYDDLWISPEMIIFTGLQQPSESHVLVFKMSPALSPGVSSGWGQTVVITPGLAPDWGDADLTALYTSVMGVAPEAGKKYFCEFYWLDKKTGFTGESMVISAVCKEGSTAYDTLYTPRVMITQKQVVPTDETASVEDFKFELAPGSVLAAASGKFNDMFPCAYLYLDVTDAPDAIGYGHHCFLARTIPGTRMDSRYQVQFRDFYPDFRNGRGRLSISNRAGGSGDGFELFGTCAIG